ncbi:MAG: M64 family metallopeptidase [Bacteroidota bacterium]|nr:M64 family metallopeptidase [Bacteroidota bacterium]
MKKIFFAFLLCFSLFAKAQWEENFENASLRIDYYHSGRFQVDYFSLQSCQKLPFYSGSHTYLIDQTNNGAYKVALFDRKSKEMIFSKGFSSLFNEWQSSEEAKNTCGNYEETVIVPYPKKEVDIVFFSRDSLNNWKEVFREPFSEELLVDYHKPNYNIIPLHKTNRKVEERLDLVFLPVGYTKEEKDKMRKDLENFAKWMFIEEPYKSRADVINIEAIEYYTEKSGIPGLKDRKDEKGELGVAYNMFSSPRYLMTKEIWALNDVLNLLPFDAVIIVANSEVYGGGGIYNCYATCYSGTMAMEVLIHEFSHSFAGLADEYSANDSDTGLQPIYAEPYEKNITTLVDFNVKWKDMIKPSTPIPTPATKEYENEVGVFEGASYMSKGFYRPYQHCMMRDLKAFCPVCSKVINDMLDIYSK